MQSLARSLLRATALFFIPAAAFALSACSDATEVFPGDIRPEFDKPGTVIEDPTVTATDPVEAPQDTTLAVLVLGSGFDRGSTVEFALAGVPTEKVRANKVKYINQNRLQAEVFVAPDADLALYDVKVTTSRGKKGIGTEMFRIIEKIRTNSGTFELFSYSVQPASILPDGITADPEVNAQIYTYLDTEDPLPSGGSWADFLGCPNGLDGCSQITYVMNPAKPLSFTIQVVPVAANCGAPEGVPCILDTSLENRRETTLRGGSGFPDIPWDLITPLIQENPAGYNTFTFYWQGQRGRSYYHYLGEEKVRGKLRSIYESRWVWDFFPDLYPQGQTDRFVVAPYFTVGKQVFYHPSMSDSYLMTNCDAWPGCLAEFKGDPGLEPLTAEWVNPEDFDGVFRFKVKGIIDRSANRNPETTPKVMLTRPDGTRRMFDFEGVTYQRDTETGLAAAEFAIEGLDPGLCYRFDLAGITIAEEWVEDDFETVNRAVWMGGTPPLYYPSGCNLP